MDYTPFYLELNDRLRRAGSQAALAKEMGCTKAYVCILLNGKQRPSIKMIEALGLEVVIRWKGQPDERANQDCAADLDAGGARDLRHDLACDG